LLVVLVSGPRGAGRSKVAAAVVRALATRGYRVAAAVRAPSDSAVRERPDTEPGLLEDSGAGVVGLVGRRRSRITLVGTPKELEDLLSMLRAGQAVPPDAAVLCGFDRLAAGKGDVLKVVVAHGAREAESWLRRLTEPVVAAVCSESGGGSLRTGRGDQVPVLPMEDLESAARLVMEAAKRLKLLH